MELYLLLGGVWIIGFTGYIFFRNKDRYNNKNYADVTNKLKQFKKAKEKVSGNTRKFFD